ncbi:MAG: flagellar basal body protein [Stellaceae bacterium]
MDLSQIPLFKAMVQKLAWLGGRQTVLAENVANINTPGFQPSDLKPLDFAKLLNRESASPVRLVATSPGHIATPASGAGADQQKIGVPGPVQVEDQMMKVSDTATQYAFTTSLYQKQIALIKEALGH